ncbi:alginate lyase family protein [Paenibacillus sp. UNC451MF]|uniref:alginate lyase family protein n=1 Tax=Paenibacillus sp. UNC451MF TaxID=1449063 RepID=UPI00068A3C5E|nr:alginate lyase family protein [Paenibacillus sp. UNC451MF]
MNISEKTSTYRWAEEVLQQLKGELEPVMSPALDIPVEPGGWWHQYVCPEHHAELLFDPSESDARQFYCPYGCKLHGEPYRGAWLVMKHQSYARYALQAAAVYAGTRDERYANWSMDILLRYAEQFPRYPVHPEAESWMLKGRAFHQALTEAIWATTLIRAYLLLQDEGGAAVGAEEKKVLDHFFSMLEESMTQSRMLLVYEQQKPENNYTAWLNAALACLYACNKDTESLKKLIEGAGGLKNHLTIGVNPDQLEYEGSTYYHVFVLRAYFILAEMAARLGVDLYSVTGEKGQSFEGMLDVMVALSNDQGELIALHDGPYQRVPYAREIAETVEIGLAHYGNGDYVPILREAYRQMYGKPERAGLEALVYGQGQLEDYQNQDSEAKASLLLESSGFVIGRRKNGILSFYADFGAHGGSHGHYDKLHLTLANKEGWIAPELGMVPYGSRMRKDWYACTESHNTVVVGQRSQAAHKGELIRYEDTQNWTYVWLRSTEAYKGSKLNRHLLLTADWLLDWFDVELEEADVMDWWMHSPKLSTIQSELWQPAAGVLHDTDPYSYIQAVAEWIGETDCNAVQLQMTGSNDNNIHLTSLLSPASRIVLAETPGTADQPLNMMNGLLHRQIGKKASFINVYSDSRDPVNLQSEGAEDVSAVNLSSRNAAWRVVMDCKQGLRLEKK